MTALEKAEKWFKANGYEVSVSDETLFITVWNITLEESTDIQVSSAEVYFRADLWDDSQPNKN